MASGLSATRTAPRNAHAPAWASGPSIKIPTMSRRPTQFVYQSAPRDHRIRSTRTTVAHRVAKPVRPRARFIMRRGLNPHKQGCAIKSRSASRRSWPRTGFSKTLQTPGPVAGLMARVCATCQCLSRSQGEDRSACIAATHGPFRARATYGPPALFTAAHAAKASPMTPPRWWSQRAGLCAARRRQCPRRT